MSPSACPAMILKRPPSVGRAPLARILMPSTKETPIPRSKEFENLILEHMDMMYAVALKLTRNAADAEDLTQNTVVKALRFHDKFQEGTYIKAWLLTILRNTFINEYRRKARRPALVELNGTEAAQDKSTDPNVPMEVREGEREKLLELLDDEVRHALEAVPYDFRLPVIMADLEDKSYKEIAEVMDCPLGTVMSRLYRGRKLLREALESYAAERGVGVKPE
ncbi:MAG: sigma-70 family RNA polymerase sigma factor [Candidatus Hydrogenedens sp.]|nr:sigma-70 family RNA polymerase sigma factor [Candidatus Hydrogenedens sp.]